MFLAAYFLSYRFWAIDADMILLSLCDCFYSDLPSAKDITLLLVFYNSREDEMLLNICFCSLSILFSRGPSSSMCHSNQRKIERLLTGIAFLSSTMPSFIENFYIFCWLCSLHWPFSDATNSMIASVLL